jgi:DNA (cytosine-5)-methyltransferase 1
VESIKGAKMKNFTAASLFCGAGGLDLGFENAGFHTVWANDLDPNACQTHRSWSTANVVCGDISKIDISDIPNTDIILGGFPCQGFSLSGPRKIDDSRNALYKHYVRIVAQKQPMIFVGENVKGLLTMGNGLIIEAIIEEFSACGYDVFYRLVNAKDFGVPQDRERVIICGFRKDLGIKEYQLPIPKMNIVTLREALHDMTEANLADVCTAPFSSRYMSRNRKRNWDQVSYTIPAMAKQVTLHPGSPDMQKIEPDLWKFGDEGVTRRLSWREAAIIQTFPKEIMFYGDLTSKYKQIGNAVPVKLAEYVAKEMMLILKKRGENEWEKGTKPSMGKLLNMPASSLYASN